VRKLKGTETHEMQKKIVPIFRRSASYMPIKLGFHVFPCDFPYQG
jgi:hypothetical protein